MEEEALRAHGGRSAAAAAQTARALTAARAPGLGQSQGAALRQHEDGGLRGAKGEVRVLHGGDGGGQRDRLQVSAGRGLERADHAADGAVQEQTGHPRGPLHTPEAAAARGADAGTEDAPQRAQRGVRRAPSAVTGLVARVFERVFVFTAHVSPLASFRDSQRTFELSTNSKPLFIWCK